MTLVAKDIMTSQLTTLTPSAALIDALEISQKQGIRHIPIVTEGGHLRGVVTQKNLVAKVMKLLSLYGTQELTEQEKQASIKDVMQTDMVTIGPDTEVKTLAQDFINHKHACLPVVDEEKQLLGIVTSFDFVKLVPTLLGELPHYSSY